jgi:UDP-GlcNAc:undecaprenyl-phosphate GlcNAc-1-phosphate transferase
MAFAALLVPVCKVVAYRIGCVAQPSASRWHRLPTPLLGGVAIVLPVVIGMVALGGAREQIVLVVCTLAIAFVGLADDLISLKPATKLITQIAIASAFLFFGYRLYWFESMVLDSLLTIVWIVGITNAFNLLDNMDGLCGGIALIACTAFLFTVPVADPAAPAFFQARYLALLLGAIAGFLIYNVHPASIFMGDTGSLFVGLSLAGLTLESGADAASRPSLLSVVAVPVLVLVIPILDTILVTVSRLLSGRAPSVGGRDHSSHRLVAMGLSERRAVAVLWTLAALSGLVGFFVRSLDISWSVLLIAVLLLAMTVFAVYLARVRVYADADTAVLQRTGAITPVVINFMYKRRVVEVVLDFCLITIAYYAAYRLRFEGDQFVFNFRYFIESLPIVIAGQLIALFIVGAYRGAWQYFSLMDAVVFAKGVLVGTAGAQLAILYLFRYEAYSRTVFVIYAALLFLLLAAARGSFRLISEFASRRRHGGERLVIYGAGAAGAIAVREVMTNPEVAHRMVGFIDDDPRRRAMRVQGYAVLGSYAKLEELILSREIDIVLVSSRRIDAQRMASISALAAEHGIRLIRLHVSIDRIETTGQGPLRFRSRAATGSD